MTENAPTFSSATSTLFRNSFRKNPVASFTPTFRITTFTAVAPFAQAFVGLIKANGRMSSELSSNSSAPISGVVASRASPSISVVTSTNGVPALFRDAWLRCKSVVLKKAGKTLTEWSSNVGLAICHWARLRRLLFCETPKTLAKPLGTWCRLL